MILKIDPFLTIQLFITILLISSIFRYRARALKCIPESWQYPWQLFVLISG